MACEDEPAECRQARTDYFSANRAFLNAQSEINQLSEAQMVGLGIGATGAGVAIASGATGPAAPAVLFVGVAAASFGTTLLVGSSFLLFFARRRCRAALSRLLDAHSRASSSCRDPDCVPPLPQEGCG